MLRTICLVAVLSCSVAFGQSTGQPAPAKPLAFQSVSIRPSDPGLREMTSIRKTSEGYKAAQQSLWHTFMLAYFPQGTAYWTRDRLSGAPPWIDDLYDIDAKVSPADLAQWQSQGDTPEQEAMLSAMLQTMLANQLHLVAHQVPAHPLSGTLSS